jgi:predicted component of type VI protein secretion system
MLHAELKVLEGKQQGKLIPLGVKKFLIGREQDCQLRPTSELVSRHHCVFSMDDYTVRLRDLGSTNGTFVNGDRIQGQVVLNDGDRIQIGKLAFQIVIHEEVPAAIDALSGAGEPLTGDSTVLSAHDTSVNALDTQDLSAYRPDVAADGAAAEAPSAEEVTTGDTTVLPPQPAGMQPPPGYPNPADPLQSGYMLPPGYMVPPGYPGMPGYGYPMPPGYPMGYPGMPMGYPQGMPPQPVSEPVVEPRNTIQNMPVTLPPPEETGAQEPVAPQPSAAAPKKGDNSSNAAADIIRSHMQHRPK